MTKQSERRMKILEESQNDDDVARDYYIGNTRCKIHTDKCVKTQQEVDEILERIGKIISMNIDWNE